MRIGEPQAEANLAVCVSLPPTTLNFASRCGLYRRVLKRAALLRLFPSRRAVPPKPRVLARVRTEYGAREVIDYAVAPGERVRAFLLLPGGRKRRRAGILASHQHAGEYKVGKSEPAGLAGKTMYHYGVDLCRRGYVVLCPDHLGFEERYASTTLTRKDTSSEGREQESLLFADCLLHGSSLTAKYLFDMLQAFDVLGATTAWIPDAWGWSATLSAAKPHCGTPSTTNACAWPSRPVASAPSLPCRNTGSLTISRLTFPGCWKW